MGKNLIQQARGKGGPSYRSPSFRFKGSTKHKKLNPQKTSIGIIVDLVNCQGHSAPLARVRYDDGELCLVHAPEGVRIGEKLIYGPDAQTKPGHTQTLNDIPEGTMVYNIESQPGDGGKFCRAGGTFARLITKLSDGAVVILPSKKQKVFNLKCRASIGIIAGAGRTEKPILKAGKKHFARRAKNKKYPKISAHAQNAVDHPFGNKRSSRKAKNKAANKNMPPGRKVGTLWPKRQGKKK